MLFIRVKKDTVYMESLHQKFFSFYKGKIFKGKQVLT